MEPGVEPVLPDQALVRALLDDAAALQYQDAVGRSHGREPVRDDEGGPPRHGAVHRLLNLVFHG